MRKILSVFASVLLAGWVGAKPTLIQGRMAFLPGATVTLLALEDGFSGSRKMLDRTQSDDYGNFLFEVELEEVTPLFLHVDGLVATLYAEPGGGYSFVVPPLERKNPFAFQHMQVQLEFDRSDPGNLNVQLAEFNRQYDFFFKEFLPDLVEARYAGSSHYVRSNRDKLAAVQLLPSEKDSAGTTADTDFIQRIDNFKVIQEKTLFEQRKNTWIADYIDYALATTEVSSGRNRMETYAAYFQNKPVQPRHPEYVTALTQLYTGYLTQALETDSLRELYLAVLRDRSAVRLDSLLAPLPMMDTPGVRYAAMLTNLKEMYYHGSRDKRIPLSVLTDMANHPEVFGWASASAQAMVDRMEFGRQGNPAPSFVFRNLQGDLVDSESFEGRFIYLQLYTKWCRTCVSEMEAIRAFYKKYNRDVEVISLSMDAEYQTYIEFVNDHDFPWIYGYGPADAELQDAFHLTTIPQYFLIDPEGNWAVDHIAAPDQGGLGVMEQQVVKWRNTHQTQRKPYMGR